jgi:hypothetical protein
MVVEVIVVGLNVVISVTVIESTFLLMSSNLTKGFAYVRVTENLYQVSRDNEPEPGRTSYACCRSANILVASSTRWAFLSGWWMS